MFNVEEFRNEIVEQLINKDISIPVKVFDTRESAMEVSGTDGCIELKFEPSQTNLLEVADNIIHELLREKQYENVVTSKDRTDSCIYSRICYRLDK